MKINPICLLKTDIKLTVLNVFWQSWHMYRPSWLTLYKCLSSTPLSDTGESLPSVCSVTLCEVIFLLWPRPSGPEFLSAAGGKDNINYMVWGSTLDQGRLLTIVITFQQRCICKSTANIPLFAAEISAHQWESSLFYLKRRCQNFVCLWETFHLLRWPK